MSKSSSTKVTAARAKAPSRTAAKPAATRASKPATAQSTKVNQAIGRGQMQGAATAAPKKLERSNFLFSKSFVDKAMTWKNKTFGSLRPKLHKNLAQDPKFLASKHATPENLKRMKVGKAPLAPKKEQLGKRKTMELEHGWERRQGVDEMKVDNLRLVSPLKHKMKAMRKFHEAAGTKMPKNLRDPIKYKEPSVKQASAAQKLKKPLKLS
ncbi:hypothetical protein [Tateyamaria sp. 1078]|uniref:hypothetical protein n=2 Tax=Tateyamaria TaxID=299261 RepID=UPI003EB9012A